MTKKNFIYEVCFTIETTACATLNRKYEDIPIDDLILSMTEEEIDDATLAENFNLYEDAIEAIRRYRWSQGNRGTSAELHGFQIASIEEEPPF